MRAFTSRFAAPLALVAIAIAGSTASAATSWTTASGSSNTINYTNGQTANGLFEGSSPIVDNDTFIFTPTNFAADSETAPATSDLLSVILNAKPGKSLSRVSAGLKGDFSTLGPASAVADAQLKLTNLDTNEVLSQSFDFGESFAAGKEEGIFDGFASIFLPTSWKNALVEYSASLSASSRGGTGFIQIKDPYLAAETVQAAAVPLPGAALAAIPAIAMAWAARRRLTASR